MNLAALRKAEIIQTLSSIPDNQLEQVQHYLESLLVSQAVQPHDNLQGIWENIGFEKLTDLSVKVKAIKSEMVHAILARKSNALSP